MRIINIGGIEIGGPRTAIIADIGSNHKQDLVLAKESIDAAVESGADFVKFQSIQLEELYLSPDAATASFIKLLEFPEDWHQLLKEYCDKKNIKFFSSPTYLKAVDLLESIDVPLYKIASAQIGTFPQLVEKVAALRKPTIISTGIAGYKELINAVEIFRRNGNNQFIILHCNSIYPTPASRVNLKLINTYQSMFDNPIGFSDHTNGTHIPCAAVVMGAKVIEKHFTLRRDLGTPDCSSFACDPEELRSLVKNIREVEQAIHSFSDRMEIQQEEQAFKDSITYRIVAKKNIKAGEKISENNINFLRAKEGLNCSEFDKVLGKTASRDIICREVIQNDCFK